MAVSPKSRQHTKKPKSSNRTPMKFPEVITLALFASAAGVIPLSFVGMQALLANDNELLFRSAVSVWYAYCLLLTVCVLLTRNTDTNQRKLEGAGVGALLVSPAIVIGIPPALLLAGIVGGFVAALATTKIRRR